MLNLPIIIHNKLNPEIWDENYNLNPEIRLDLVKIADDFYRKSKFEAPVIDVYFMGSLASFNWNVESDIDIHIIVDIKALQMPEETAIKMVKLVSSQWNGEHNIEIKGHKVELNIQDMAADKPYVNGIYSIIKNQWIKKPSRQNIKGIDKSLIQIKYTGVKKYINNSILSGNQETMKRAKDYLDAFRQYGLDTDGELSVENIVYKLLRKKGIIGKLKSSITNQYDKELSINEDADTESKTPNFHIETNGNSVKIFLHDEWFCNSFRLQEGFGYGNMKDGEWVINAHIGAFRLKFKSPAISFPTLQELLNYLENWYSNTIIKETYSNNAKFGIGAIGSNGEVKFKEITKEKIINQSHGYEGNPYGRLRFRYVDGNVQWSSAAPPDEEDKQLVDSYLISRGYNVTKHTAWNDLLEVNQRSLKQRQPKPFFDKTFQSLNSLTLDNLNALKAKAMRSYSYGVKKHDENIIIQAIAEYDFFNTEIKKRLKYINAPINESYEGYDVYEDFMERRDRALCEMAEILKNPNGKKHVPWKTISASLLTRVWYQFGKYNKINENDLDKIADNILTNIAGLRAANEISGHSTNYHVREEILDICGIEFSEEEWDNLDYDLIETEFGVEILSDYGAEPLEKIYKLIFNAKTPEEKLYACDKALNVVHQRNDLAALFVEGGSTTLQKIADQGGYYANYEYGQINREFRENILTESAIHINTPEFRRWFGNSKVVDKDGTPLRVYHGTNQPISMFNKNRRGITTHNISAKRGFYFTDHPDVANRYANMAGSMNRSDISSYEKKVKELQLKVDKLERQAKITGKWEPYEKAMEEYEKFDLDTLHDDNITGQNIVPVFLKIENPYIYDFNGINHSNYSIGEINNIIDTAIKNGNDGIIMKNVIDPEPMSNHYIVFNSNQIKSATGNQGTFNNRSSHIAKEGAELHNDKITSKVSDELSTNDNNNLNKLIKQSGINILSNKELYLSYFINDELVGALFTSYGDDTFGFDIIVDKQHRRQGIGKQMIKDAISEYKNNILDMNPDAKLKLEVVNQLLISYLEKLGFKIDDKIGEIVIMSYGNSVDEGVGAGVPEKDPLHIKDHRWQIDMSKRKTPLMESIKYYI